MLSQNEYRIMELLWNAEGSLSRAQILKGTEGRNWNPSSIHLILNSMISKGVIGITDETRHYGRTYEALISREDYTLRCMEEGMPGSSREEQLLRVVAALVKKEGISEEGIRDLEQLLEAKRKELSESSLAKTEG